MQMDIRVDDRIFVLHDSPDVPLMYVARLRDVYPAAPDCFDERFFPTGSLFPILPFVYFFHHFMFEGNGAARAYLSNVCLIDFYLLFAETWWQQKARDIVLPNHTIKYLLRVLEDIPIDPDHPFRSRGQMNIPYNAQQMRKMRRAERQ